MAISKGLRFRMLLAAEFKCRYCGRSSPDVQLEVDHVLPQALGGGDYVENLVVACKDCNAGKSARLIAGAIPIWLEKVFILVCPSCGYRRGIEIPTIDDLANLDNWCDPCEQPMALKHVRAES